MAESGNSSNAGRVAFTYPDFSLYQLARFLIVAGLEMQSVAVGWQIYEITKRPLDLGLVGLAQFSPGILLFLVTGHAADTFNRRKLLMACYVGFGVCSALLLFYALSGLRTVLPMYAVVVLLGVVRSFNNPASRSLLPQIMIQGIKLQRLPLVGDFIDRTFPRWLLDGLGISILTTPRGVMTGRTARKEGVGGEILCRVW